MTRSGNFGFFINNSFRFFIFFSGYTPATDEAARSCVLPYYKTKCEVVPLNATKTYRESKVQLRPFLTTALNVTKWLSWRLYSYRRAEERNVWEEESLRALWAFWEPRRALQGSVCMVQCCRGMTSVVMAVQVSRHVASGTVSKYKKVLWCAD